MEAIVGQDIQQVLEEKLEHGRELRAQMEQTLSAANDQKPVLKFLENVPGMPRQVSESAAYLLVDLRSYTLYLQSVEAAVDSWSANLRAALDEAKRVNDHRTVESASNWLKMIRADHAALMRTAYQKIEARPEAGVDMSAKLEHFLEEHRKLLGNMFEVGLYYTPSGSGAGSIPVPQALLELNHETVRDADEKVLAELFEYGDPVEHNLNLRRFTFLDKSAVEIQAFLPVMWRGLKPKTVMGAGIPGGMGTGALVGNVVGGVVATSRTLPATAVLADTLGAAGATADALALTVGGTVIGLGVGLVVGAAVAGLIVNSNLMNDSAWQGYTIRSFSKKEPDKVVSTWSFSFVNESAADINRARSNGNVDPEKLGNFADNPEVGYATHWWTQTASVRPAVFDGSGLKQYEGNSLVPLKSGADHLVQALAQFAPDGAALGTAAAPADGVAPQHDQALLALSH